MKKTITSAILFLLLAVNSAFAQFTADDVVFWVGEGDSEAILVIDFRDETIDPSFAWGYRFNAEDGKTFADMLLAVEAAEPNLDVVISGGGFLSSIYYNSHSGIDSNPDWWSTWSGSSLEGLGMNGGISETLANGGWYGVSYGFMNPEPTQPTVTYPAYSSLWFTTDELTYSIGEGTNSAVIVVDFATDLGASTNSFAWKINFDGTITPQQALELIAQNDSEFDIIFDGTDSTVTYGDLTADLWTAYNGTNLSDWIAGDFTNAIENNDWFGISAGNVRRPFTPVPAPENPLNINDFNSITLSVYPNPATDFFTVTSEKNINNINIFNLSGQKVFTQTVNNTTETFSTNNLSTGLYLVEITTENGTAIQKLVIK